MYFSIRLTHIFLGVILSGFPFQSFAEPATSSQSRAKFESSFCTGALGIYEPDHETSPNPVIKIVEQQVSSPDDRCVMNADNKQTDELRSLIKKATLDVFAGSSQSFEFIVTFTLTEKNPAKLDMGVKNMNEDAKILMTKFKDRISSFKDFHSKSGTVYVTMHYKIGKQSNADKP